MFIFLYYDYITYSRIWQVPSDAAVIIILNSAIKAGCRGNIKNGEGIIKPVLSNAVGLWYNTVLRVSLKKALLMRSI